MLHNAFRRNTGSTRKVRGTAPQCQTGNIHILHVSRYVAEEPLGLKFISVFLSTGTQLLED